MSNHFHVLVRIPSPEAGAVSDEELMRRYRLLYPKPTIESNRERYGPKRQRGPRSMRGGDWGGLSILRDLRREVFLWGENRIL